VIPSAGEMRATCTLLWCLGKLNAACIGEHTWPRARCFRFLGCKPLLGDGNAKTVRKMSTFNSCSRKFLSCARSHKRKNNLALLILMMGVIGYFL